MKMFPRARRFSSWRSSVRSYMASSFLRRWKSVAETGRNSLLALYIPHSIVLKKKDLLNLDGVMKGEQSEEVQDVAITNLHEVELPQLTPSKPFEQICWFGSQSDLFPIESVDLKEFASFLDEQERLIQLIERESKLGKRFQKYSTFNSYETYVSRWVSAPIAYLFPEERREEWLGDLYETNQEMLHKGYPLWMVNVNNLLKTMILVSSALEIKFKQLLPFGILKRD
jgi:hypothetical protein